MCSSMFWGWWVHVLTTVTAGSSAIINMLNDMHHLQHWCAEVINCSLHPAHCHHPPSVMFWVSNEGRIWKKRRELENERRFSLHPQHFFFQKREFKHVTVQLVLTYRWFKYKTHCHIGRKEKEEDEEDEQDDCVVACCPLLVMHGCTSVLEVYKKAFKLKCKKAGHSL